MHCRQCSCPCARTFVAAEKEASLERRNQTEVSVCPFRTLPWKRNSLCLRCTQDPLAFFKKVQKGLAT
jgi:hypothetical protein